MKKIILIVIALAVIGGIVYYTRRDTTSTPMDESTMTPSEEMTVGDDTAMTASTSPQTSTSTSADITAVKEFALDSFMKMDGANRIAGFSVKDITVKKGDHVRIVVTNIAGTHDFNLDEFGVDVETPEGQKTTIEFTADKVGNFKYYCSKYNHRQLGQEGTLHVTE